MGLRQIAPGPTGGYYVNYKTGWLTGLNERSLIAISCCKLDVTLIKNDAVRDQRVEDERCK